MTQRLVLALEPHVLERLVDRQLELLRAHGLRDVVDRPRLDRLHRVLDGRVAGEHDDRHVVPLALEHREELEPRDAGHPVVGDDQVDGIALEQVQRLGDVPGAECLVPGPPQRLLDDHAHGRLVVDVQNGRHASNLGQEGGRAGGHELSLLWT